MTISSGPVGSGPIAAPGWLGVGYDPNEELVDTVGVAAPLLSAQGFAVSSADSLVLELLDIVLQGGLFVLIDTVGVGTTLRGSFSTPAGELVGLHPTTAITQYTTALETIQSLDNALLQRAAFATDSLSVLEAITAARGALRLLVDTILLEPSIQAARGFAAAALDEVGVQPLLAYKLGALMADRLGFATMVVAGQQLHSALLDAVQVTCALRTASNMLLADGVAAATALDAARAVRVIEELGLAATVQGSARYGLTIAQLVRLSDGLAQFLGADLADIVGVETAVYGGGLLNNSLTESVGVAAALAPQFLLHVTAADSVDLEGVDILQMLFDPTLHDSIDIGAGYVAPDGSFTTWVMNARNGAMTEYQNYAFTSFAQVGDRYVATSPTGLYELLGDDDDGTAIVARIKSGFMQFGDTRLSRLAAAYIAATGEGVMVLKIITKEGDQYVYQTSTRDGRSTKVHMGKGQRSRYFAFELTSAGQDFDLDTLEFVPIVVQRRV